MANTPPGQQLNDLLVTRNFEPQALDSTGKPAPTPAEATTFSFNYVGESGKDYGTVVVMLGEDNLMNVFFGDNVGKSMEGDDKKEWFDFLYQLRQFAKRNLLTFSLQNLNKLKYSMQGQAAIKEGIFESWVGKKDVSYNADSTQARLMIKHKRNIGENEARFRNIDKLFIETADGERFKLPFKSLSAGRAMLEHVRQGGTPYDYRGQHIVTIVTEMSLLSRFKRANQGKIFEGETAQLVEQATEHYTNLHHTLKSLSSKTGYKKYFESWNPAEINDEDVIIEDLRHMFVEQNIDSRIEQALPLLARLKQETAMKEINVFEGWMNLLSEGTWALPDTPEKQQQLISLLADELPVGPDASNATELLYNLLGDDELFDKLNELAKQDANADARTVIINRLEQMKSNPAVAQVIGKIKIEQTPQPEAPAEQPTAPVNEEQVCETCQCESCECETVDESIQRLSELSGTGMKRVFKNGQWVAPEVTETTQKELDDLEHEDEEHNIIDPVDMEDQDLEEASDTVKFGKDGKPTAWSHEGDWEKTPKRNGKPVDPRGEVTNMVGKELKKAKEIANLKEDEGSPVESAILGRIMNTQTGLLAKYGPQAVMDAAREEAEWVGDVDEIGSSDVSAWVNNVVRNLESSQINELSPDTLKSYIKKAGSSGDERSASNLASRAANKLASFPDGMLPAGVDDGSADDHKSYMRSKGIGRAVDKLEELSPKTLGSYVKQASSDRAMRNFDQGVDMGQTMHQREPSFGSPENSRKDDRRRSGIIKAVNRLTKEDQLDELSPNTLKSYIKKAAGSVANKGAELGQKMAAADEVDRYTNRHMPNQSDERERMRGAVGAGYDDISRVRSKANQRVKGIGRASDRLEELSPDTLQSYLDKGNADIKNRFNQSGDANDKKLANRMRSTGKAMGRLSEGGMSEVDLTLQEIARGNVDIYDIYAHPKSNVEKFVSNQIHDRVEEISRERGIPMDDDIDKILQIIVDDLADEYGIVERREYPHPNVVKNDERVHQQHFGEDEMEESVGGGNFLEEGTTVYEIYQTKKCRPNNAVVATFSATGPKEAQEKLEQFKQKHPGYEDYFDVRELSDVGQHLDQLRQAREKNMNETTALQGQYGHSGKLQTVKSNDADIMDRIKFLAGISK